MKTGFKRNFFIYIFEIILLLFSLWFVIRKTTNIPSYSTITTNPNIYSENEKVSKAIAISYLTYGCESSSVTSDIINNILDNVQMGIVIENAGINRNDNKDPLSAVIDTSKYIKNQVGEFRFLADLKDDKSSFYGVAFCDDNKKCIWISYAGSISIKDAFASIGLVVNPTFTHQEKKAYEFFETVIQSYEYTNCDYSIILTGHSLGGALSSIVSLSCGCEAITINGVDGLAVSKLKMMNGNYNTSNITNHLTFPSDGKFSFMNIIQKIMFWGDYTNINHHIYSENGYTQDAHCAFSFIRFIDENQLYPVLPDKELSNR